MMLGNIGVCVRPGVCISLGLCLVDCVCVVIDGGWMVMSYCRMYRRRRRGEFLWSLSKGCWCNACGIDSLFKGDWQLEKVLLTSRLGIIASMTRVVEMTVASFQST